MSKEHFIAAHEQLIEQYLERHPNATEAEAYEKTADHAYGRMRENLARHGRQDAPAREGFTSMNVPAVIDAEKAYVCVPLCGASGETALVSEASLHLVAGKKWYLAANGYVVTPRGEYMHRLILGAKRGVKVDHLNFNRRDNRDANIRLSSSAENNRNVRKRSHSKQPFKGVRARKRGTFCARIRREGREIYLGTFATAEDAARAYDAAAASMFGEFANLNFGVTQ